jgi:hypothetical protein
LAGIEGAFDFCVKGAEGGGGGGVPPRLFGETDAVLPTDNAAHGEDSLEKLVENTVHPAIVRLGSSRGHQVDVNVAVSRMTKAGNRNSMLLL